jgi:Aldo/keto reductase family
VRHRQTKAADNGYANPTATAPHLDSTGSRRLTRQTGPSIPQYTGWKKTYRLETANEERDLGTTGITVPRAFLGCGTFGGIGGARHLVGRGLDRKAAFAALDEALALGIDVLDTAERYADGESERAIGEWLRQRPREQTREVRIATKVAPPADGVDGTRFDRAYRDDDRRGARCPRSAPERGRRTFRELWGPGSSMGDCASGLHRPRCWAVACGTASGPSRRSARFGAGPGGARADRFMVRGGRRVGDVPAAATGVSVAARGPVGRTVSIGNRAMSPRCPAVRSFSRRTSLRRRSQFEPIADGEPACRLIS